jgi:hypothetical protein
MSKGKTISPFDDQRRNILDYDPTFFLQKGLEQEERSQEEISRFFEIWRSTRSEIEEHYKANKKQIKLYLDGQVRLQWEGGMIPARFGLDGWTRDLKVIDLEQEAIQWAHFELWQGIERRKRFWRRTGRIAKWTLSGGFLLAIMKAYELLPL